MATAIAEQLSSVPVLSTILRTDFTLIEAPNTFRSAASLLQQWADLKVRAFNGSVDWSRSFARVTASELLLEFAHTRDSFTFLLSHPDVRHEQNGRDWIAEVELNAGSGVPRLSTRLSVRQPRNSQEPLPRAPKLISELVHSVGATD